ncbi:MAG: FAD-dependent oxidoreductase [Coriobacteriia bacterium]
MKRPSDGVSRRDFVKGALAASGAVAAGGLLTACSQKAQANLLPDKWDKETDIVVVGGGGAGCAAAYGAANAGAKVIVLQSQATSANSSTAVCGGFIMFAETEEQKAEGIKDSAEQMAKDILDWGEAGDEKVIKTFADNNLEYYKLIKELGVPFQSNVSASPGSTIPRSLTVDPAKHQQIIEKAAKDKGAEFLYDTTGTKLIQNPVGEIVGVVAKSGSTTLNIKANKAVIMASGGFTRNASMLEECVVGLGNVQALSGTGHTGEGHLAVFQVGGSFSGRPWIYSVQGMYPGSKDMKGYAELFLYGAIQVNLDGERYINEDLYWCNKMTALTLQQPLKDDIPVLYEIIDQTAYDLAVKAGPPIGLGESTIKLLVSADTIEELGTKINAPKLAETVKNYNADIDAVGYDQRFGRKTMVGTGTPPVTKIEKPPFYAFANTAWLAYDPATSFKINEECLALDQFDQPIKRLYLVGEISLRTIVGNHYQYGLATGAGGVLGLYAGKKAAGLEAWA